MLTKKHYKIIADAIADTTQCKSSNDNYTSGYNDSRLHLARLLCIRFAADNPNFSAEKFYNACKLKETKK